MAVVADAPVAVAVAVAADAPVSVAVGGVVCHGASSEASSCT